jgi:hypothetical protein
VIYRLRMDGLADSSDQLEREFLGMVWHFALAGYLDGFVGQELFGREAVIESMAPEELVDLEGSRFSANWRGRYVVSFKPREGEFDPLRPHDQSDCYAFEEHDAVGTSQSGGVVYGGGASGSSWVGGSGGRVAGGGNGGGLGDGGWLFRLEDRREDLIVLPRRNVLPSEWVPEQSGTADSGAILAHILGMPHVAGLEVRSEAVMEGAGVTEWFVDVKLVDGQVAKATGTSPREAALSALAIVRVDRGPVRSGG